MKFSKLSMAVVSIVAMSSLNAANDGSLAVGGTGTNSSGNLDVSITVPSIIHVQNLQDFSFVQWDGTSSPTSEKTFCVRTNTASGYTLKFDSLNASAGYVMEEQFGGSDTFGYNVEYAMRTTAPAVGSYNSVADGIDSANITTEVRTTDGCGSGDNISMKITIPSIGLANVTVGDYGDTLQVTATAL
jgi:hypothetical protein